MRSDVLTHATLELHAGRITIDEWVAVAEEFILRPVHATTPRPAGGMPNGAPSSPTR
jgi:hypothetical protein